MTKRPMIPDYVPVAPAPAPPVQMVRPLWRCASCGTDLASGESHVQVIGYGSADTRCVVMRYPVVGVSG